ncbi:YwiC-like family protein [Pasteurellaceae bacterium HPA106]|uniref:YwiC-like family protein n=1 Tax=Spirabiliibacterium pneumoniae TaxID=221400 RepID=UPI001AADA86E|nr:YwiC-like family protein [Spirabiliibacterium pneumoniae]MBE2896346.1 YwiC-like family protein [Spirabiliibacterium pneumoniae]
MKLYVSNQHGAIVMALLPFFYGMLTSDPLWWHVSLLLAWCCLYLFTYPFFNLFKQRNLALNRRWAVRYALSAVIFALPALYYNPAVALFLLPMLPFALVNVHYVKAKDERALGNDIAAIVIFGIAGMAAYYFPHRTFDAQIWSVFWLPTLFFIGTTLYVKTMLRERKNVRYLYASYAYHIALLLLVGAWVNLPTALCFLPAALRALIAPHFRLTVKQVGILEFIISAQFLLSILAVNLLFYAVNVA